MHEIKFGLNCFYIILLLLQVSKGPGIFFGHGMVLANIQYSTVLTKGGRWEVGLVSCFVSNRAFNYRWLINVTTMRFGTPKIGILGNGILIFMLSTT